MTPKKAKDENLTPVEETTTEEVTPTPVEEPAPVEPEEPAEEEAPAEESKEETPVEEKPAEAPKGGKVEIKEEELKTINLLTAPEEIKKIVEFYGVTSKDLFDKDLKKF